MSSNVVTENIGEARGNVSGWWNRSRTFLIEVRNELKRVTWPTRKEVYAATIMVILFSAVLGFFLWTVDLTLDRAVLFLTSHGPRLPITTGFTQGIYRVTIDARGAALVLPPAIDTADRRIVRGDVMRKPVPLASFEAAVRAVKQVAR